MLGAPMKKGERDALLFCMAGERNAQKVIENSMVAYGVTPALPAGVRA